MHYRLNLDISPQRFKEGAIEMFLNWANRPEGDGTEPAMIFTRARGDRRQVVGLRLSEIHGYMNTSGYGAAGIIHMGMKIAEGVGCAAGDKYAARNVADLIVEYTPDLVKMPNDPPRLALVQQESRQPKAELAIQIDGETVMETEVAG